MNSTLLKCSALACLCLFLFSFRVSAQDDLMKALEAEGEAETDLAVATFKGTRLINFHTLEVAGKRTLDFRISHRFGEVGTGINNAYGVDGPASIRFALEYSYDGRLMAGIGRTSYQKSFDGFLKYRLLRQTASSNKMPVSVTLVTSMFITAQKDPNADNGGFDKYDPFTNRMSFAHQVIVGRKFSSAISAQIAPVMVHYNMVEEFTDKNDMFFITAAGRIKVSNRVALTAEYGLALNEYTQEDYYDPLSFGIDIETGGHVFQMNITNAFGLTENQFLPYTDSSWGDEGWRFGFNISRVFTL